jgi:threonine/homoserine/homoserine lactone efflux protein
VISGGQLLGFTAAAMVMIVIPGPGVLFVVGRALSHGRRTALATAAGHAAGNYVVAAAVSVGLGEILQRSAAAFVVVKVAGAAYLAWLGIQAIRHRKSLADAFAAVAEPREGWRALRDGVVVGITNPKSYILFGAILPQFVNRGAGDLVGRAARRCLGLRVGVRGERGAELVRQLAAPVRAGRRGRRPGHDRRRRDRGHHRPQDLRFLASMGGSSVR